MYKPRAAKDVFFCFITAIVALFTASAASAQSAAPTLCAQEGGYCTVASGELRDAYYGAQGEYVHKVVAGSFACNNSTFPDPIRGVPKTCYISEPRYTFWGNEYNGFIPPGMPNIHSAFPQIVAYGADERYHSQVTTGTNCNNSSFGDPAPGVVKSCHRTKEFRKCADEGGICTINGIGFVSYGAVLSYSSRIVVGSIECNNRNFGDPARGRIKACYTNQ